MTFELRKAFYRQSTEICREDCTGRDGRDTIGRTVSQRKIKILRLVTAPEVVSFHLRNILAFSSEDIEMIVVGTDVEKFAQQYPQVRWINLNIFRKISLRHDIVSLFGLCRILSKERPDIIHSLAPKAGLVGSLAGFLMRIPVRIHTFTGQVWMERKGLMRSFLIFLDRLVVTLNTYCNTDSFSQSEMLVEYGIQKHGKPLPVLGKGSIAGVDLQRFNYESFHPMKSRLREKYQIPQQAVVFVFLGRKNKDKGVFELLGAFHQLRTTNQNVFLLMIGPDESQGAFESAMAQNPLSSESFLNVGMTDKAEEYLATADVFCLPSYREGFGSVVIEAGALGLPTIGVDIPGLRDSIQKDKTGLLVTVKDQESLFQAMKKMSEDSNLRMKLGQQALEFVRNYFASEKVYQLLVNLYRQLIKN